MKADLSGWQDGLAAWGAVPDGDDDDSNDRPSPPPVASYDNSMVLAHQGHAEFIPVQSQYSGAAGIQLDSTGTNAGIQLDGSPMHLDNAGMQADGSGMHMNNAGVQIDNSGMQMDVSGMHVDNSGMQMQIDNMHMDGSGMQGAGYSDEVYVQQSAPQERPVRLRTRMNNIE